MAIEKKRGNRETKKPVPKSNAAAPSAKGTVASVMKTGGRS